MATVVGMGACPTLAAETGASCGSEGGWSAQPLADLLPRPAGASGVRSAAGLLQEFIPSQLLDLYTRDSARSSASHGNR